MVQRGKMKIFITGYRGDLGKDIMPLLAEHEVTVYDLQDGHDVTNLEQLLEHIPDTPDLVIHLANVPHPHMFAEHDPYIHTNVGGTRNLIAACKQKGAKSIVFVSSLAAIGWDAPLSGKKMDGTDHYPLGDPPWDEERAVQMPIDYELEHYGASKVEQENMLMESGIKTLILRCGPYGHPNGHSHDYWEHAFSAPHLVPLMKKILQTGVTKTDIIHVCGVGMFGGQKLQSILQSDKKKHRKEHSE